MPDLPSIYDASALLAGSTALPRPGSGASGPNRLAHAAVQFESVLLGQWLQSAEKSFATVPGGDQDEDPGGEQMMSFAMQQLAGSIAASGGLGIARLVQRGLEKAEQANGPVERTVSQTGSPAPTQQSLSASPSKRPPLL